MFRISIELENIYNISIHNIRRDLNMNRSISTMTGKTKIKIVFLGNQSVGKSSVIEKYVKDHFDETANVL